MIFEYGFIRVGACTPVLKVADPIFNINEIKKMIEKAIKSNISVLVFPELCITSYTCADLFGQEILLDESDKAMEELCEFTKGIEMLICVGAPVRYKQYLFNCAVFICNGEILGIIPKTYIPNYGEYYEKRWFSEAFVQDIKEVEYCNYKVPFGTDIIFENIEIPNFCIGAEICEDLWAPIPPSSYAALQGATIIVNLSASNELVNKADYRLELIKQQSARLIAGYVYSSAGVYESTTDLVFSGHSIIAENGILIKQSERFSRESTLIYNDIDIQRLNAQRRKNITFKDTCKNNKMSFRGIKFSQKNINSDRLERYINPHPFVPSDNRLRDERCREIFNIQAAGLAKRIEHTRCKCCVVGISGGLDSTLALLVISKTFKMLRKQSKDIYTITMPGFGTTDRTYNNTIKLCRALNTNLKEINIIDAAMQHFKDIDHDPSILDVTYENVQARERTQILMDIANKEGGIVVGTGDLSELALGWATYNGDHMSMYAVNCSVPKTLVRYLVKWAAENEMDKETELILKDILDTPVSPELLPADKRGEISQKTEDIIGPYELHDFFLYHMLRYDASPKKVLFLAENAFNNKYNHDEIKKWLECFYKRFFSQQFKRSCIPDGPKVGTISLSPRGDLRMPSDSSPTIWLSHI